MKKKNTKQRIMDAFWDIYTQKRIEKITVKEITLKAEINRSTFYEYFLDVYDVLEQIELSLIPNINELPPIKINDTNFGMPADLFIKLFGEKEKYYVVLLGENGDPSFNKKFKESIKPIISGLLKDTDHESKKLDFVIEYLLSAMAGIMQYWFENKDSLTAEEIIELTSTLMDKGVSEYIIIK